MTNGKPPSFKDVYELVDNRTAKIDDKLQHLSDRFDNLEAGRLSHLETQLANLKGKIVVWGVFGGAAVAVLSSLATKLFTRQ